jgi:hypothetical protein
VRAPPLWLVDTALVVSTIALAVSIISLAVGCTAHDRATAARTALDAVDQADRTCADLHGVLHPDAGDGGGEQ